MDWKDSHKFVENLSAKDRQRYRELTKKYLNYPLDGHEAHINACNDLEKELANRESNPYDNPKWVDIHLKINTQTGTIHAVGGDREPCMHGYPPCCDTNYIGLEWLKQRMVKRN